MQIGHIDLNKLRFLIDKAVGLTKETLGVLFDDDRLQTEGRAQQERGSAELDALREEIKAQTAEAKADAYEVKQRAAQRAKAAAS